MQKSKTTKSISEKNKWKENLKSFEQTQDCLGAIKV